MTLSWSRFIDDEYAMYVIHPENISLQKNFIKSVECDLLYLSKQNIQEQRRCKYCSFQQLNLKTQEGRLFYKKVTLQRTAFEFPDHSCGNHLLISKLVVIFFFSRWSHVALSVLQDDCLLSVWCVHVCVHGSYFYTSPATARFEEECARPFTVQCVMLCRSQTSSTGTDMQMIWFIKIASLILFSYVKYGPP